MSTPSIFNKAIHGLREPFNAWSHFIGAGLALVALGSLLIRGIALKSPLFILGSVIFCIAMMALYTMSGLYHGLKVNPKALSIMRKMDHTMIYVLIAGTYTPVCLLALAGAWRIAILSTIWGIAVLGIATKWLWFNMPRVLYTAIYVVMGWTAIVAIWPLYQNLTPFAFSMMVTGGVLYTIGALIYAFKPKFFNSMHLGFHECFHLFILAGSTAHFLMVFTLR